MSVSSISSRIAAAALLALGAFTGAYAGDAAQPVALGFSADGDRFAFAEWGRQDGSGYPYASVFVIDLPSDKWIGKPVRVVIHDEETSARAGLLQALDEAEAGMRESGIDAGAMQVFAGAAEFPSRRNLMADVTWSNRTVPTGPDRALAVVLKTFPITGKNCADEVRGFALEVDGAEVYRDLALSASRRCPEAYSLERVYVPGAFADRFAVALIGVHARGFEGLNMRHVAVPVPLK